MDARLFDVLEDCLAALEAGSDLEVVLARHPELRAELISLVETAQVAESLAQPEIPAAAQHRSRTRLLSRAAELRKEPKISWNLLRRLPKLAMAALLVLVIVLSGSGLIVAAAQTLPGDPIYPVKRAVENIRLVFTFDPRTHHEIETQFQERRLDEVEKLVDLNRSELVLFYGEVTQQYPDMWLIGGLEVLITPETLIIGAIQPGDTVEVEGLTLPDGTIQASEIHLQSYEFDGFVEAITPTVWMIAGREVQIEPHSEIGSDIQVGDYVLVSVRSDDFGNLFAIAITPTATPTATPLPLPSPTLTPELSESENTEIDATEELAENEIEAQETDEVEDKIEQETEAGEKEEQESAEEDDNTREPDETPGPSETDEPEETDEPTETDEPEDKDETEEPDETPEPTETEEPDD